MLLKFRSSIDKNDKLIIVLIYYSLINNLLLIKLEVVLIVTIFICFQIFVIINPSLKFY